MNKLPNFRKFIGLCFTPSAEGFDLRSLAVFRITFGLLIFYNLWGRFANDGLRAFFTQDGVLPPIYPNPQLDILSYFPTVPALVPFLFILFASALFYTIGYWSRLSGFVLFICEVLIHYRASAVESSGEMVLRLFLIWSVFFPIGLRYSLDSLLRRRKLVNLGAVGGYALANRSPFTLAFVFFSILMSLHYGLNGFQKDTQAWFNPDVLYMATMDPRISMPLGEALKQAIPRIIFELGGPGVLVFEVLLGLFIFLGIVFPFFRLIAAFMIWALHGSFIVFMDLVSFPWTYWSIGFLFIPTFFWESLGLRRKIAKLPLLACSSNIGGQYQFDGLKDLPASRFVSRYFPRGPYLGPSLLMFFNLTLMAAYNPLCPQGLVKFSAPIHSFLGSYIGNLGLTCGWNLFRSPQYAGATYALLGYKDGVWHDVSRNRVVPWVEGSEDILKTYAETLTKSGSRVNSYWADYIRFLDSDASAELKHWLHRYMTRVKGFTQYRMYWVDYKMPVGGIYPEVIRVEQGLSWKRPNWGAVDPSMIEPSNISNLQDMVRYETFWGGSSGHRPRNPRPSFLDSAYGSGLWSPLNRQVLVSPMEGKGFYLTLPVPASYKGGYLPLALRVSGGPDFGFFVVYSSKSLSTFSPSLAISGGFTRLVGYDGYSRYGVVPRTLFLQVPEADILTSGDGLNKRYIRLYFEHQKSSLPSSGSFFGAAGYLFYPDYWSESNYSEL